VQTTCNLQLVTSPVYNTRQKFQDLSDPEEQKVNGGRLQRSPETPAGGEAALSQESKYLTQPIGPSSLIPWSLAYPTENYCHF